MRLAASIIPAGGAATAVYTVPALKKALFTLSVCNRNTTATVIQVALTTGGAPADADWIQFDLSLQGTGGIGGSTYERTGLALGAGQKVYVRSTLANVSAGVWGVEETA